MKLSQFKVRGLLKKIKFTNGKMEVENVNNEELNGEFEVYEVDGERFDIIRDIVRENEELTSEQALFNMIPVVTNIEVDISEKEFTEMLKNPSESLLSLLSVIGEQIDVSKRMSESTQKVNQIIAENEESQPVEINKDEVLCNLYKELAENSSDTKRVKEILEEINALVNE